MSKYAPKVTKLTGKEIPVTADDLVRAIWLAKRFSSLTYIQRMVALFANFVAGYEEFSQRTPSTDRVAAHRSNLASFHGYEAAFTDGIEKLRHRDSRGYAEIYDGCFFRDWILGRQVDFGLEHQDIGWQFYPNPPEGIYAWAVVAANMCAYVDKTLRGLWAFPDAARPNDDRARASDVLFPPIASIAPAPKPRGISIKTGQRVPVSGIWMPALPSGAPNYLWEGNDAWEGKRAGKRLDYSKVESEIDPQEPYTTYEYASEPTTWTLFWEDDRYKDGKIPDEEAAYLDATTEPPPWPPVVPPGGAKLKPPIFRKKRKP